MNDETQKKPYAKPSSVDLGKVAPVLGNDPCSYGNGADTYCKVGYSNASGCGNGLGAGFFGCNQGDGAR